MKSRTCIVCIAVAVMMALSLCVSARAQELPKATVRARLPHLSCRQRMGCRFRLFADREMHLHPRPEPHRVL